MTLPPRLCVRKGQGLDPLRLKQPQRKPESSSLCGRRILVRGCWFGGLRITEIFMAYML